MTKEFLLQLYDNYKDRCSTFGKKVDDALRLRVDGLVKEANETGLCITLLVYLNEKTNPVTKKRKIEALLAEMPSKGLGQDDLPPTLYQLAQDAKNLA